MPMLVSMHMYICMCVRKFFCRNNARTLTIKFMSYIDLFMIGFLWSLPGFSIITAVAVLNNVRKCWNLRQPLKILVSPRMVLSKSRVGNTIRSR